MRKAAKALGVSALAIGAMVTSLWFYWTTPKLWPEYRQGKDLVRTVESFRRTHGRLPAAHEEIDPSITESGPVYYTRQSGGQYTVHFGLSLTVGESYTYDSSTG